MHHRGSQVAMQIAEGFDLFHDAFRRVTRCAAGRFADRDWAGIQSDTVQRLELYGETLDATLAGLSQATGERALWAAAKAAYESELRGRDDYELALTFFNSVSRRRCPRRGVDRELEFLASDLAFPYRGLELAAARTYATQSIDDALVARVLADAELGAPLRNRAEDVSRSAGRIRDAVGAAWGDGGVDSLDMLRQPFFRNKAAYLVGRVRRGDRILPVVLALVHDAEGVRVDAVLTEEDDVSVLFSFARWYFHTAVENPRPVIGFLHSILPRKRIAELYISLGYHRHGKTELYADLMDLVRRSPGRFEEAPGEPGTVMTVFTHPAVEFVFKVIRDRFPAQKEVTPDLIREKYRLVLRHDRVGRLVDYQEFEGLTFPRDRFPPDLLEELLAEAGRRIVVEGDDVVLRHVYVGRRVTPLDLYLAGDRPAEEKVAAVDEWGRAIEDLAAANLFAGDILRKNFGVTRHGRVVFYDYDEIVPLSDCRFRRMPPARHDFQELAPEPWFAVGDGDVFPEELERFFDLPGELREPFRAGHGHLFTVGWWRERQERVERHELLDFFPYPDERRLSRDDAPEP